MSLEKRSIGKTLAAHALTAGLTMLLAVVVLGGRLGLARRPPVAQIHAPQPAHEPAPFASDSPEDRPTGPAARGVDARSPAPPDDVLKDLDPEETRNVL